MESFGIALFRNEPELEFLLVQKKCTYYFLNLINGVFPKKIKSLYKFFGRITNVEKNLVLVRDFRLLYVYAYSTDPNLLTGKRYEFYAYCERKFYGFFTKKLTERIIENSTNADLPWEFPKGRISPSESAEECATREFIEETGITEFTVLDLPPVSHKICDANKTYIFTIYLARSKNYQINKFSRCCEIATQRWFTVSEARRILSGQILDLFLNTVKKIH